MTERTLDRLTRGDFRLSGYSLLRTRRLWGDYGAGLINFMSCRRDENNIAVASRLGPHVPMFCELCWHWAVSDTGRQAMEELGFDEISFKPVRYDDVRFLPWHTWDLEAEEAEEYPEGGEPEGYFEQAPPLPVTERESMEACWELVAPCVKLKINTVPLSRRLELGFYDWVEDSGPWARIFDSRGTGYDIVCDDETKEKLRGAFGPWIHFEPIMLLDR